MYDRNKPIDLNETGYYPLASWYEGDKAGDVRVEAWEFMVGGGSSFNNLNAVYTARDPAGKAAENMPVLKTMQSLKQFIEGFDFLKDAAGSQLCGERHAGRRLLPGHQRARASSTPSTITTASSNHTSTRWYRGVTKSA